MSERATIHLWGFFDGDTQRPTDSAAICDGSVYDAYCTVVANVMHHGGGVTNRRSTRTLDGWLVGAEFETPAHDNTARMWHRILRASDPWPDPTATPTDQPEEVRCGGEEVCDG